MTTSEVSVLLFFIDGLGIGTRGPFNPLDNLPNAAPLAVFQNETPEPFLDGIVVATDPRLGVEGRPQSASGQTTILTGVNAPAAVGYHKQGFPNKALLEIIGEHSIFRQLTQAGVQPITFANATPVASSTNVPAGSRPRPRQSKRRVCRSGPSRMCKEATLFSWITPIAC